MNNTMTQAEYEAIAAAIHRTGMASRIGKKKNSEQTLSLVASDIAATIANSNPDFDRKSFLEACGFRAA